MSEYTNAYGVSYIQTAAGAVITGEIKRYNTYKDMCHDANINLGGTRLASVANASHDEDFEVPADHIGGVLYQRDYVGGTWILLYSEKDLAVPTYVNWNHILDVPPWVGGITHNRVKLTENRLAELRTTYYSFGRYNLIVPRADLMKTVTKEKLNGTYETISSYAIELGEEIVLEQYEIPYAENAQHEPIPAVGAILIPYEEGDIVTETAQILTVNAVQYQVIFTYAPATVWTDENTTRTTTHAYSFRLICTEDDNGKRYWTLCTTDDEGVEAIRILREEQTKHLLDANPHNQYVLKNTLNKYLVSATTESNGFVTLAVRNDVDLGDNTRAVTPLLLKTYLNEVITIKCDNLYKQLHKEIANHISNNGIHITQEKKIEIDNHMSDNSIHITQDEKDYWNSLGRVSGNASESLIAHLTDELAHSNLFNAVYIRITSEVSDHNTDPNAHDAVLAPKFLAKQDKLASSGTWISIDNNVVNCTLKAGTGISIDPTTGAIKCTITPPDPVSAATTEAPGIVQLVDEITEDNEDNTTMALTPKAVKKLFHIIMPLFTPKTPRITCTSATSLVTRNIYNPRTQAIESRSVLRATKSAYDEDAKVNITSQFILPRIPLTGFDHMGTYKASDIFIAQVTETNTIPKWAYYGIICGLTISYNKDNGNYYYSCSLINTNSNGAYLGGEVKSGILPHSASSRATLYNRTVPGTSYDTSNVNISIWMDAENIIIQAYDYAYGEELNKAITTVLLEPSITSWTWTENN